jgi:NAD(P)-dependent dehydrogenase (short-subunit alcohol dehydrogenase family)
MPGHGSNPYQEEALRATLQEHSVTGTKLIWSPNPQALRGRVAVVAGATRGAGRGIATALGEAGATVICTGRSTRGPGPSRSDYNRPETIEETAELVGRLGGVGVARAIDHLDSSEVEGLAKDIRRTHGHIDVLVNDIWGAEVLKGGPSEWNTPVWKHDLGKGLRILRLGVETHLISSHHLLPLLISRPGGLLVEVTDGTLAYNTAHYRLSAFYDLAKVSINRLAFSLGHELEGHGATAVSLSPGWLRSEMMLDNYGISEERWRDALAPTASPRAPAGFAVSESPRYVGRAVAALAADPEKRRWNQQSLTSGQLASIYGFTDVDNSQPNVWKYNEDVEAGLNPDPVNYR